ncbi:MAG: hypothetical protein AVDCRST_MAG10-1552, partial [uncultured Acidimicrobiales bacterium]
ERARRPDLDHRAPVPPAPRGDRRLHGAGMRAHPRGSAPPAPGRSGAVRLAVAHVRRGDGHRVRPGGRRSHAHPRRAHHLPGHRRRSPRRRDPLGRLRLHLAQPGEVFDDRHRPLVGRLPDRGGHPGPGCGGGCDRSRLPVERGRGDRRRRRRLGRLSRTVPRDRRQLQTSGGLVAGAGHPGRATARRRPGRRRPAVPGLAGSVGPRRPHRTGGRPPARGRPVGMGRRRAAGPRGHHRPGDRHPPSALPPPGLVGGL